jgi:hypothetical protein
MTAVSIVHAGNRITPADAVPAPLRPVQVHRAGHYLQTDDGRPFFWLGDTAWELIHRTTRDECTYYLRTRARQGFTVVQAVVLAEMDGVNTPNADGQKPFIDGDPLRPNGKYFDRIVEIADEAANLGLRMALLPAWGDKLTAPWGAGPRLFRTDNLPAARAYARYLGSRFRGRTNVLWMLGGDRPARMDPNRPDVWPQTAGIEAGFPADCDWTPVWREIAAGLAEGLGIRPVCLYHPQGGEPTTSYYLHGEPWLSINGMQSGHGGGHDQPVWEWVARDWTLIPPKPTLDLEPNYEDHPYNPWPRWDPSTGYFRDLDVRKQTYRSVFAGACGVTYGHHAVWGFVGSRNDVINHADRDWISALYRPAASQMFFLRQLIESRPFFPRIPDQSLIAGDAGEGGLHLQACRDEAGTYAFIYFPMNDRNAILELRSMGAAAPERVRAAWYDPRTGFTTPIGEFETKEPLPFRSPSYGPDWVLVIDDTAAGYAPPGLGPEGLPQP